MMRRQIHILFFFFCLISINQSAFAVKAFPYPVEITQPDGSKLTIMLKGDEHHKLAQTVDGYSIMRNSKKIFEYATLDSKGYMVPSGVKAKDLKERSSSDIQLLSKVGKGITYSKSQVSMMKSISKMAQKSSQKSFPTTGDRSLVCILIGFTDKAFTKSNADFTNLFNQLNYTTDGATGSVKEYYAENSYNQLNLTVTVAGPYTASHNMAYYGANDSNGDDVNPRALVTEAVTLANADVNYADFDNDANGTVDGIYVIYAGYGEEAGADADAIWAHAWAISSLKLDNKWVNSYSCSSELRDISGTGITRIGVICHEFGHVMGASDFYDTDGPPSTSYDGTGNWDLMAGGSWNGANYDAAGATPAHHNPYTKIYVYGWAAATTITSSASFTLNNSAGYSDGFYLINTATANEYFLIENRQKVKFDSYVPGHGLLIYHVDGDYVSAHEYDNDINVGSHQGLYPVCASATTNPGSTISSYGDISSAGCPFPGTYSKTSFNDYTTPHSKSWAGVNTNKSITGIAENNTAKTVSFNVTTSNSVSLNDDMVNLLGQNYPNPFDLSTTINFKLAKPSYVSLIVFNALGQKVDIIVDEYLAAGNYSKPWSPTGIAAGIYFYQLKMEGFKDTKRLIKK